MKMATVLETARRLAGIPQLTVLRDAPLSQYTRFGIGGPAGLLVEAPDPASFIEALHIARSSGVGYVVIGAGSNLIVADEGFPGVILKFTAHSIACDGTKVTADAGVILQNLVDCTVDRGLQGLETMTGIPGLTGAAIYGNAGAYGHSISERVTSVEFFDGDQIRSVDNAGCEFHYRESIFKRHKEWIIFRAELAMTEGDAAALRATADKILNIRNAKYPPTMKCAGSIFKNFLLTNLPENVGKQVPSTSIIEGKVPSAWFLEQVGAKGMHAGGIQVADYHANLIYNTGAGTARELRQVIGELKRRVRERFGIEVEEEVQYVGCAPQ
jgi:UDP-N-acetylmuramate dehydrogenase